MEAGRAIGRRVRRAAEFDPLENCWRVGQLEPFELSLFKGWEHSGRPLFFGFIRIDRTYNETEAVEAFRRAVADLVPHGRHEGRDEEKALSPQS